MSETLDQILKRKHWLRCMENMHSDILEAAKEYLEQKRLSVKESLNHVNRTTDEIFDELIKDLPCVENKKKQEVEQP